MRLGERRKESRANTKQEYCPDFPAWCFKSETSRFQESCGQACNFSTLFWKGDISANKEYCVKLVQTWICTIWF